MPRQAGADSGAAGVRWTEQEDNQLSILGHVKGLEHWDAIALSFFPGKTGVSCRERQQRLRNVASIKSLPTTAMRKSPLQANGRQAWTRDQDDRLAAIPPGTTYEQWDTIAASQFPGKSGTACRKRRDRVLASARKDSLALTRSPPSTAPSDVPALGLSSTSTLHHFNGRSRLSCIISVARKSSIVGPDVVQTLLERCGLLAQQYLHQQHEPVDHEDCDCTPDIQRIVLNGISSNTDSARSMNQQIVSIRTLIDDKISAAISSSSHIVICFSQADGFSTDLFGSFAMFRHSKHELVRFYEYIDKNTSHVHHLAVLMQYISAMQEGWMGEDGDDTYRLLKIQTEASLLKKNMPEASLALKARGLKRRNCSEIEPDHAPELRAEDEADIEVWDPSAEAKRRRVIRGRRNQDDYIKRLTFDYNLDGKVICPESDCAALFEHRLDAINHMTRNITLSESPCPFCQKMFNFTLFTAARCPNADNVGHGSVRQHLKRHFDERTECPDCEEVFSNDTDLQSHLRTCPKREMFDDTDSPEDDTNEFVCSTSDCGKTFAFLGLLNNHVKLCHQEHPGMKRCGYCSALVEEDKMAEHQQGCERMKKRVKCSYCFAVFRVWEISMHVALHTRNQMLQDFADKAGISVSSNSV